jgi:hypothetical protein
LDVRPGASGGIARIKFKEEFLPMRETLGGKRSIFSHNCVLAKPREDLDMAVKDLAAAFPAVGTLEANHESPLRLVNDMAVEEVQVDVGELHFGNGFNGKTSIAVWRTRKYEKAFCGEFAFQCKFDSADGRRLGLEIGFIVLLALFCVATSFCYSSKMIGPTAGLGAVGVAISLLPLTLLMGTSDDLPADLNEPMLPTAPQLEKKVIASDGP